MRVAEAVRLRDGKPLLVPEAVRERVGVPVTVGVRLRVPLDVRETNGAGVPIRLGERVALGEPGTAPLATDGEPLQLGVRLGEPDCDGVLGEVSVAGAVSPGVMDEDGKTLAVSEAVPLCVAVALTNAVCVAEELTDGV